ncbi:hypothetical protein GCM10023081_07060 [Arthrobacter ginkgonis]|uniref:General stress protein 17M-like domain-containing protein n=1 Tax=Arthrobacter ginkgonis TaxID=1630594 RepID=A0ABP7BYY3_9MICC
MSSLFGPPSNSASSNGLPNGLPRGELLGRYESYLDAQKVVDYLADNDFPVASVTIVGNDLKTVEHVTAKLSYPKVAIAGAAQGAMFGLFVGLILSIFGSSASNPMQLVSAVGLGMAIWMIFGVVSYSFRKGKRDFASSSQVLATSYDVVVAFEHAAAARAMASKLPMSHVDAHRSAPAWAPPQATGPLQVPGPPAGAEQAPPAPSTSGYHDLPDGRPQFGVRIDTQNPAPAPAAAGEPEASPAAGTPAPPADGGQPDAETGSGPSAPEAGEPATPSPEPHTDKKA